MDIMPYITTTITFIIYVILIYACYTDLMYRKIKNRCVILALIASLCLSISYGDVNILAPTLFLIVGYIFTITGCIGAGDIKLIVALLVGIPDVLIYPFFIMTCIQGIPLALICLIFSMFVIKSNFRTVPFGIAIAIGYISVTI